MWPTLFRRIEHDKGQGKFYTDPEDSLTSIVQAI